MSVIIVDVSGRHPAHKETRNPDPRKSSPQVRLAIVLVIFLCALIGAVASAYHLVEHPENWTRAFAAILFCIVLLCMCAAALDNILGVESSDQDDRPDPEDQVED